MRSGLAEVPEGGQVVEHEADVYVGDSAVSAESGYCSAATTSVIGGEKLIGQVQHWHFTQHVVSDVKLTHLHIRTRHSACFRFLSRVSTLCMHSAILFYHFCPSVTPKRILIPINFSNIW